LAIKEVMHSLRRKFIGLASAVLAGGVAIALIASQRPAAVTLNVVSVERSSSSSIAHCEIRNRGDQPVVLTIHTFGKNLFFHRLERPFYSWQGIREFGFWKAISWRRKGCLECGIDAEAKAIAPGETFPFTASITDPAPFRIAVDYQTAGSNFTMVSETIRL